MEHAGKRTVDYLRPRPLQEVGKKKRQSLAKALFFIKKTSDVFGLYFLTKGDRAHEDCGKYLKQRPVSASYTPLQPGERTGQLHGYTHTH